MSEQKTVGDLVAAFLEQCGVETAFGVISIHNMPILDAIGRRGNMRFVMSRGEAGAGNMADAYARVRGSLGVFFTSTGTAAGNAAGAMVEAQTAGTPLLHITGQIETAYLDRNCGYIHEARDQLSMLKSISERAFRITSADTALEVLKQAVQVALTPPTGPVSIEIPIDIQAAPIDWPSDVAPPAIEAPVPDDAALDALADKLASAKRPLLWCGGGARGAGNAVARLLDMGFGLVTSTQGRGVAAETDPRSLGAFTSNPASEDFYRNCDAMLVAGSRLRGNETLKYKLGLPSTLYQIDADEDAGGRNYPVDHFVHGDARLALEGLADRLSGRITVDPSFGAEIARTRQANEDALREGIAPYHRLVDDLQDVAGDDFVWVRDVTISNSTWGNRYLRIFGPRDGVHALGGGIGQGLSMGIGAALAAGGRRTFCLVGDGGFQLNLAELATAAQENADLVILLMNSQGYGVIKNIQDARYGGRRYYTDLLTPDFAQICSSMGLRHRLIRNLGDAGRALSEAAAAGGPSIIEVDMTAVGDFAQAFAGPPVRMKTTEPAQ